MTEVATVSIVAKNKYSERAGGLPHPARGGTKVRKSLVIVIVYLESAMARVTSGLPTMQELRAFLSTDLGWARATSNRRLLGSKPLTLALRIRMWFAAGQETPAAKTNTGSSRLL